VHLRDNVPRYFFSPVFRDQGAWVWDWRPIGGGENHRQSHRDSAEAWHAREARIAELLGRNCPTLVVDVSPGLDCYTPSPMPCPTIQALYSTSEHRSRLRRIWGRGAIPDYLTPLSARTLAATGL